MVMMNKKKGNLTNFGGRCIDLGGYTGTGAGLGRCGKG
jgi:hypothetical protein